jgi:flavodoxin
MKSLVIYGSTWGSTRKIVRHLPEILCFPIDIVDVKTLTDSSVFDSYELLLFFAPTSGDEELQLDLEDFIARHLHRLEEKYYAVCELGNYFGYDDFKFGAEKILSRFLSAIGGQEFVPPFAMETFPYKDFDGLARWCKLLNEKVSAADARL